MKFRAVLWMFMIPLSALATPVRADEKGTVASSARFEALKKLAGDWVEVGKDGKPTDKLVSSIRVTANGSAIHETIFPGGDHEMVTLYHLDGPDLVLTHYCILGNQPKMRAEPSADLSRLVFRFVGGTNLKSENENHMHQATFTLVDNNHIRTEWVAYQEGKPCHKAEFDLVRKAK
jgi:hypothetical protein